MSSISITSPAANTPKEDRLNESDDFYLKWSGPIILGSFVPAVYCVMVVVGGPICLSTFVPGSCGYPINTFVELAMVFCYIFLLVYTWIFLGDTIYFTIPFTEVKFKIFKPFTSLVWLMGIYGVLFFLSFIIWVVGSYLFGLSAFCADTAPTMYKFTSFVVIFYWLMFIVIFGYVVKLYGGKQIGNLLKEAARENTADEVEERICRKVFNMFDKDKEGFISVDDLPNFLTTLGVYVPEDEVSVLQRTLSDKDSPDKIMFDSVLAWFKKMNKDLEPENDKEKKKANDSDDD